MPADHVVLARVEYDGHSQSQIIAYLQKIIPTIPTHADEAKAGKTGHAADEASAECFRIVQDLIRMFEPHFKNAHFCEEKEWRLIRYTPRHTPLELLPDIHYHFTADDGIRYTKMKIGDSIKETMLGPRCKMDQTAMSDYLAENRNTIYSPKLSRSEGTLR